ncbi:HAD family phosphatase [Patescibacteria group bacterium]|nr:HAD family phosphatase [Patescibacteria group bacterium]MBU1890516.1 HAD family phosphatase [Patescibacteria group bacterium]
MIKGIIYDLDDVIINSIGLHIQASDMVFAEYGVQQDKVNLSDKLKASLLGRRVIDVMKILIKHYKIKASPEEIHQRREEIFYQLAKDKLELLPGVKESIKLFREHDYKMAIASSATKKLIHLVLSKFELLHLFPEVVAAEDIQRGKPNPEVYQLAAKKLVLEPSECVVLEDANNGIKAAKKAGCKCIAIRNQYVPEQNLSKADLLVDSLNDITTLMIKKL